MYDVIVIFVISALLGGVLEVGFAFLYDLFSHKPLRINHKFTIGKKLNLISLPIWGLVGLIAMKNTTWAFIFLWGAVVGTFAEFFLGKFLHREFGVRIWTYKHGAIDRYTSIYSIPYWGAAGIVFSLVGKAVGL